MRTFNGINWQYTSDPNNINYAIRDRDENWEGLESADQIISITYDTNHACYVIFWRCTILDDTDVTPELRKTKQKGD